MDHELLEALHAMEQRLTERIQATETHVLEQLRREPIEEDPQTQRESLRIRERKFGTLKDKIQILGPDWDRPQNDLDAWLRGHV